MPMPYVHCLQLIKSTRKNSVTLKTTRSCGKILPVSNPIFRMVLQYIVKVCYATAVFVAAVAGAVVALREAIEASRQLLEAIMDECKKFDSFEFVVNFTCTVKFSTVLLNFKLFLFSCSIFCCRLSFLMSFLS